jgi:serine/threonine protein kinase/tetratricopeptide (TPR) repeat protein
MSKILEGVVHALIIPIYCVFAPTGHIGPWINNMGDDKEPLIENLQDGTVQIVTDRATGSRSVTGGGASASAPNGNELVGQTVLGHYHVLEKIGEGGMSVVYKAQHLMLKQFVAIKMLHGHLAKDEHAILRFQQEAQSAIRLEHPGIVGVRDFGILDNGQPYLIMDYVDGRSLSAVLDAAPFEPQRALKITMQVCEALEHAHENGVVHRDIKPSNVIIINEGTAEEAIKIVDFGIAKIVFADTPSAEQQQLTRTGESLGSPPYMSPEQCLGMPLDARSDIYSTGCLLYEALCGRPPFQGSSAFDTMHMQIFALPESVGRWRPSLPHVDRLDEILLRAMAKESVDRFATIGEMANALRATLSDFHKPNILATTYARGRVLATRLRSRRQSLFVAFISLALVLCSVALVWQRQHPTTVRVGAQTETVDPYDAFERPYRQGMRLLDEEDYKGAISKLNEAAERVDVVGLENDRYQECLKRLSEAYAKVGNRQESKRLLARYESLQKFSLGSIEGNNDKIAKLNLISPQTKEIKSELAQLLTKQAQLYTGEHKSELSQANAQAAYKTACEAEGASSPLAGRALCAFVSALTEAGELIQSKQQYEILMTVAAQHKTTDPLLFAEANYIAGRMHSMQALRPRAGDLERQTNRSFTKPQGAASIALMTKAKDELSTARDLYRKLQPDDPRLGQCLNQIGNAQLVIGDYKNAQKTLEEALKFNTVCHGQNSLSVGKTEYYLAKLKVGGSESASTDAARKRWLQDAQGHLAIAQSIFEKSSMDSANSELLAEAMSLSGVVSAGLGNFESAERSLKASIKIAVRWDSHSYLAAMNYHRLLDLYQRWNLSEKTKSQKIQEAMVHMQQISAITVKPTSKLENDLDKSIGDTAP